MGLKYDDLIQEEKPEVQTALKRLTERESYDRAFRLKQAIQLSVMHRELPKENWLKPEEVCTFSQLRDTRMLTHHSLQDQRYLTPLINEVKRADEERAKWDTVKVNKK